jgi:flagellar basal-body rod protein FlgC
MNLFGVMSVSASALEAERMRAQVVASNMANAETTRTAEGGPYKRQQVVFETATAAGEESFASQLIGGANSLSAKMARQSQAVQSRLGGSDAENSPGVKVAGVENDGGTPQRRYEPSHPDAGADGYVSYPDINPLTEMVDLMGAQRSYGLNASAIQAEKGMIGTAIDLGRSS